MQMINLANLKTRANTYRHPICISVIWIIGLIVGKGLTQISSWNLILQGDNSVFCLSESNGLIMIVSSIMLGCIACISGHRMLYAFLFIKAVIFSVVASNVTLAFGQAGWLARILLLSADSALVILLLFFALRSVGSRVAFIVKNAAYSAIAASLIIFLDVYFVAPIAAVLLNG
jgi:hypothetical protein